MPIAFEIYSQLSHCVLMQKGTFQLAEIYDEVACAWLEGANAGDPSLFPAADLKRWIRRATLENKIVPTLCGSSLKSVGVQPLLDAVADYLPGPNDIKHSFL